MHKNNDPEIDRLERCVIDMYIAHSLRCGLNIDPWNEQRSWISLLYKNKKKSIILQCVQLSAIIHVSDMFLFSC